MKRKIATLITAVGLSSLACDVRTPIGAVQDGSTSNPGTGANSGTGAAPPQSDGGPGGSGGGSCTPGAFPGDAPFTFPPGVMATWTGYFQGGSPLASDAIVLTLEQTASGENQIHAVFGTAAPPPPATSATDYYPPGASIMTMQASNITLIEGVSYLAHDVTWQGNRLKFSLQTYQAWEGWCELQTSYALIDNPGYNCVPGSGGAVTNSGMPNEQCISEDAAGTKQTPVPCAQFFLCDFRHCDCAACGCVASVKFADSFDLTFDGDLATGVGEGFNVRLMRSTN